MGFAQFQIIHNEAGLVGSVYIELCFCALYYNLDLGPSLLFDINVGFVNSGIFLPQADPAFSRCTEQVKLDSTQHELVVLIEQNGGFDFPSEISCPWFHSLCRTIKC